MLGLDKVDIIRLAKEWGSHDTSVGPELCDLLGPTYPATTSSASVVQAAESRVGLERDLPAIECISL